MAPGAILEESAQADGSSDYKNGVDGDSSPSNGTNGHSTNGHSTNGHSTNGTNGTHSKANGANGANASNGASASPKHQPIAIVGMSCRLPGDVIDLDSFWQVLSRAQSAWSEIPKDRFNADTFYHPNPEKVGTLHVKGGHFLKQDPSLFDAPFFNITAPEAKAMDPQHRIMLECAYEAIENAGIPKHHFAGKDVGVYCGGSMADYDGLVYKNTETVPKFHSTGTAASLLSNRISYYFDLRGPSVTVDSACSSSLAALHLACQSLRDGEIKQAIVGGCHLNLTPGFIISMSTNGLLSENGKSLAFDSRGTGFGKGEGAGCIVLKRLDEAIRDGDLVRAVIAGSGVNQDGRTNGITMPSGEAQEELMRHVYSHYNLDPRETGFIEAHGTGTRVGDPIEAKALHNVFGENRTSKQPLYVGSVKSNIGHLEGASGIVSVIKAALMLERGFILPNADFKTINPKILNEWHMKVPTSQIPWPRKKKYISVNNFGFGGTNAHVVLEKAPRRALNPILPTEEPDDAERKRVFVFSGHSESAVKAQLERLSQWIEQRPDVFDRSIPRRMAQTLAENRSLMPWRVAVHAVHSQDLVKEAMKAGTTPVKTTDEPNIGFVFTGQGAQWFAMGRELMDAYPVYKSSMEAADDYLRSIGAPFSLIDELSKDEKTSKVATAQISQPSCTAVQISLVELLRSWGIRPKAVTGHSSGEIGAAYAAGYLNMEQAMRVAYHRGTATTKLKELYPDDKGGMMAVGASAEDIRPLLKTLREGKVVVACVNSPNSITASGDDAAIDELAAVVEAKSLFNRKLRVDVAYHSHHMERVGDYYGSQIGPIKPATNTEGVEFYSSLTGGKIDGAALTADYWVKNLTNPVQFASSLHQLCALDDETTAPNARINMLVEIGPHSAMAGPVKQIIKAGLPPSSKLRIQYATVLERNKDAVDTALSLAEFLWTRGTALDFHGINFPNNTYKPTPLNNLYTYPWQHARYWHESRTSDNYLHRKAPRNDFIGILNESSNSIEPIWSNIMRLEDNPVLKHHQYSGLNVFPFAGYLAMAMEASAQRAADRGVQFEKFGFRDVSVQRALSITEESPVETMIQLRAYGDGIWDEFRVFATNNKDWTEHCHGLVSVQKTATNAIDGAEAEEKARSAIAQKINRIADSCKATVDAVPMYENLATSGVVYGPTFQGLSDIMALEGKDSSATITIPNTADHMPFNYESDYITHPATLDLCIQIVWPMLGAGSEKFDQLYMPTTLKEATIMYEMPKTPGTKLRLFGNANSAVTSPARPVHFSFFASAVDDVNRPLVSFEDLVMTPVTGGSEFSATTESGLCSKLEWKSLDEVESDIAAPESASTSTENNGNGYGFVEDVSIVCGSDVDTVLLSELQQRLQALTGKNPTVCSFADVEAENNVCIVLAEVEKPLLRTMDESTFGRMKKMLAAAKGVMWVTRGANGQDPEASLVLGLSRSVRSETELNFVTVDFDLQNKASETKVADILIDSFRKSFAPGVKDAEKEYMERNGQVFVPRVVTAAAANSTMDQLTTSAKESHQSASLQNFAQPGRPLKLVIDTPGSLDTLYFTDDEAFATPIPDNFVEIEVKAAALNFKDIMIAMGQLPIDRLGQECSGVIVGMGKGVSDFKIGDSVCAMAHGTFATHTRCPASSVSKISSDMPFDVASTVPIVYGTAYYALFNIARLVKGEKVLIHAAAGGVGQAAIQLAKMVNAEIFATVGSVDKKDFLIKEYGLDADHIFFSRDTSFSAGIKAATHGEGVDVVLNSLAGDALQATWECLAHFGRFVEIGKKDIVNNSRLEMQQFANNATFASFDETILAKERPKLMKKLLADVLLLFYMGLLKPIRPMTTYPISDIEAAFRALQTGKAMGKIVIVPKDGDKVKAAMPKIKDQLFNADATYLIVGGTGGIGRSISQYMVSKGARNIVLLSRTGRAGPKIESHISEMKSLGATILVQSCDVSSSESVSHLMGELKSMPPIRGVIQAAMVLRDAFFESTSHADFNAVLAPKVAGTWNLHNALLDTPLDFFIALSSLSGIVGNRGQAAYAAANTFLDSFISYRHALGLPGTSLALAAVDEVGFVAEHADTAALLDNVFGDKAVSEKEIHALVAAAVSGRFTEACDDFCITGLKAMPDNERSHFWLNDKRFEVLKEAAAATSEALANNAATLSLTQKMALASNVDEAKELILADLRAKISAVLMLPVDEIDGDVPVASFGMDSLVVVEVRNWITRETEAGFQMLELMTAKSLRVLVDDIVRKSRMAVLLKLSEAGAAQGENK